MSIEFLKETISANADKYSKTISLLEDFTKGKRKQLHSFKDLLDFIQIENNQDYIEGWQFLGHCFFLERETLPMPEYLMTNAHFYFNPTKASIKEALKEDFIYLEDFKLLIEMSDSIVRNNFSKILMALFEKEPILYAEQVGPLGFAIFTKEAAEPHFVAGMAPLNYKVTSVESGIFVYDVNIEETKSVEVVFVNFSELPEINDEKAKLKAEEYLNAWVEESLKYSYDIAETIKGTSWDVFYNGEIFARIDTEKTDDIYLQIANLDTIEKFETHRYFLEITGEFLENYARDGQLASLMNTLKFAEAIDDENLTND